MGSSNTARTVQCDAEAGRDVLKCQHSSTHLPPQPGEMEAGQLEGKQAQGKLGWDRFNVETREGDKANIPNDNYRSNN